MADLISIKNSDSHLKEFYTSNLNETYATHSNQNYWYIYERSDIIWNTRKEVSVFVVHEENRYGIIS